MKKVLCRFGKPQKGCKKRFQKVSKKVFQKLVDKLLQTIYTLQGNEAWLSLVERCVRDAEVASSNLVASIVARSVGQAVKTPPSHGGNRGSIPLRTARKERRKLFFFISGTGTENRPDHIYHAPPAQTSSGIEVVITGLTRNHSGPRPFRPPKTVEISRFFDGSNL